jgi:hypothetical protein
MRERPVAIPSVPISQSSGDTHHCHSERSEESAFRSFGARVLAAQNRAFQESAVLLLFVAFDVACVAQSIAVFATLCGFSCLRVSYFVILSGAKDLASIFYLLFCLRLMLATSRAATITSRSSLSTYAARAFDGRLLAARCFHEIKNDGRKHATAIVLQTVSARPSIPA